MEFIFAHAVFLNTRQVSICRSSRQGQETKKVENLNSHNVKLRSPITAVHICARLYQHEKPSRIDASLINIQRLVVSKTRCSAIME